MFQLICVFSIFMLSVSCSRSKTVEIDQAVQNLESNESIEFDERTLTDEVPVTELDDESKDGGVQLIETQPLQEAVAENEEEEIVTETVQESISPSQNYSNNQSAETSQYTVQKNETLMFIAFKLYGDYGRWKEIAALNSDKISSNSNIQAGSKLTYYKDGSGFIWNPSGLPYLIKPADTLSKISSKVYGRRNLWRPIWQNNKPLIKDPNKIFTGFTIYCPDQKD